MRPGEVQDSAMADNGGSVGLQIRTSGPHSMSRART